MRSKLEKRAGMCRAPLLLAIFLVAGILLISAPGASAQKNKKKNTDADNSASSPLSAGPDYAQVDNAIGEMLGAFQVGNIDLLHKHYADNATFVSGTWEPPVVGWANYLPIYQRERAAFQGMQVIRKNTVIFTHADVAWACYQWEFDSMLNGNPYTARGQTTLVFNKVGADWLIVHNHTSEIYPSSQQQPAGQNSQAPQAAPAPGQMQAVPTHP
jgi:ketosteroid isomerase-like protein